MGGREGDCVLIEASNSVVGIPGQCAAPCMNLGIWSSALTGQAEVGRVFPPLV